jgi:glycine dehydrogenase subunit 2
MRDDQGQLKQEGLIFERGGSGRVGFTLPELDVPRVDPEVAWGADDVRGEIEGFPEVSEVDVVRHFTRISQQNFGIESGLFPLGSCTMKYNPKVNERVVRLPGFAGAHPYMPAAVMQGGLELMRRLEAALAAITGMDRITLQPAAGAQGELTGVMMIAAYHASRGDERRRKVLIPDSAHGTNPATASFCGFEPVEIPSNSRGTTDIEALRAEADENTAALMLTNPNTLGLFEDQMAEIAEIMHGCGAQIYCDGANLNAILGKTRPGDIGIDVFHINLHKTFTTPHGGGGPGGGPVGVQEHLVPFLPRPTVEVADTGEAYLEWDRPESIGKVQGFYGNFGIMVRAYTYIRALGAVGLRQVAEDAVLNANYVQARLKEHYHLPQDRFCMHEVIFSDKRQKQHEVTAMDVCKRLMDYGYHPPTVYFPLVVPGALMVEPTESVSREDLDAFVEAMISIAHEAESDPERVRSAPHSTFVSRLDEARAARKPILRWEPETAGELKPAAAETG